MRKHIPVKGNTIWKPIIHHASRYQMLTAGYRLLGHEMCINYGMGTQETPMRYSPMFLTLLGLSNGQ